MSIFLCASQRFQDALETFDPLEGDPLLACFDPWVRGRSARIRWSRTATFISVLIFPIFLFAAIAPSSSFGGVLFGKGGLIADIGVWGQAIFVAVGLALVPVARRLLGDLLNELVRLGAVDPGILVLKPRTEPGRLLRALEAIVRVGRGRTTLYLLLVLVGLALTYRFDLLNGMQTWHNAALQPGSFLSRLGVGHFQPNAAGLWFYLVFNVFGLWYLALLVGRLWLMFAFICAATARQASLEILPSHPDGAGGLRPVGQVALFLSLFTFLYGLSLAGTTANRLIWGTVFAVSARDVPLEMMYLNWAMYLTIGTMLFFLPLLPLRRCMALRKRQYLVEMLRFQRQAEREHEAQRKAQEFNSATLQKIGTLDSLIERATEMAVWPFDRKTFARYAGLLVSPLLPLLAKQLPEIIAWFRAYLGLH